MFQQIGVYAKIFYDGHEVMKHNPVSPELFFLLRELESYDIVVVAFNLPAAFLKGSLNDGALRQYLPDTPIVLYDNKYLGTMANWAISLRDGRAEHGIVEGGNWGLDRYDWYLAGSVATPLPMLPKGPHPYSLIGLNLDDGSLFPSHKEDFVALIDFERPAYLKQRKIQIEACEETNTKYIILEGQYPLDKIRDIYRKCSIYFVAHVESFGLPICEVQACGGYVFTPDTRWCRAHWIKDDVRVAGWGSLSPNFIVYDSDKDKLIRAIRHVKMNHNPHKVFDTFLKFHRQLFYGNLDELGKFVNMVRDGSIHSKLHIEYPNLDEMVDSHNKFMEKKHTITAQQS